VLAVGRPWSCFFCSNNLLAHFGRRSFVGQLSDSQYRCMIVCLVVVPMILSRNSAHVTNSGPLVLRSWFCCTSLVLLWSVCCSCCFFFFFFFFIRVVLFCRGSITLAIESNNT